MDPIGRLTNIFEKFPGIGPRQAQRFVHFLLRSSPALRREFVQLVQSLGAAAHRCTRCMRYFASTAALAKAGSGIKRECDICLNSARDRSTLAIVASDADLAALERSGTYRGMYFVLGGTIHLANEKTNGLRIKELLDSLPTRLEAGLKEVVLAFPANPEGDATGNRIRDELSKFPEIRITSLGRGLSTGSELEYADPETLKSALENRR